MTEVTLVISTKGRCSELGRMLSSLAQQTMRAFDVIVVDQNDEDLIHPMLEGRPFPIQHVRTPGACGVCCGRNHGLALAQAPLVIFPDDDCWYPADFLERAIATFHERGLDALTGRPTDEDGKPIQGRFERTAQAITRSNVWTTQIEWLAVWRRELLEKVGGFNEAIGVGADSPWQSAEGQDLMLRVLAAGGKAWFDPTLVAHDAGVDPNSADANLRKKVRGYGRGMGYVIRAHRLGPVVAVTFVVRSFAGAAISCLRGNFGKSRYFLATGVGRVEGLLRRCFDRIVI